MSTKTEVMKKVVRNFGLLLCAGILSAVTLTSAQAQNAPRVGIKGGFNFSNLYVNDANSENTRLGWHGGFYGQFLSSEAFAIQPEVNFSTKGSRVTQHAGIIDQETKYNFSYIDIPVLAVFKLGTVAEIHAGPYWSYLVNANVTSNGDLGNGSKTFDRSNFDDWDYGLVGGIGFNLGGVQLGARYNYGLNTIARSSLAKTMLGNSKNQVAQLYLSFNFNARGNDNGYSSNRSTY
jgi:hypothetical protein